MPSRPAARRIALLVLGMASASLSADSPRSPDAEAEALRRETTLLRREIELSRSDEFYLRLDAAEGRLALMLRGVPLDDYALVSLERASPRVLFVPRRPAEDWMLRAFSKGRLSPERERDRIEIVASAPSPDASPSPPPIPRTAEESYSVPSRYRIEFEEGISLEIAAPGSGRNRPWWQRAVDAIRLRWQDRRAALSRGAAERVRLRAELEAEDAAALYRSLPPDVRLLVVGLPPR
jgi:hypothetical protein